MAAPLAHVPRPISSLYRLLLLQVKNLDTGEVMTLSESFDEGVISDAASKTYVRQQSLLEESLMKSIASALTKPSTHVRGRGCTVWLAAGGGGGWRGRPHRPLRLASHPVQIKTVALCVCPPAGTTVALSWHGQFTATDYLPPGCRFRADILAYGTARDDDGVYTTYRIQVTRLVGSVGGEGASRACFRSGQAPRGCVLARAW